MAIGKAVRNRDGEKIPTRTYSSNQEKQVARALGGVPTPNSGATPFAKGDLLTKWFLVECKTQTKPRDSFSIKKEWFNKNVSESLLMGKEFSAVAFNFGPGEQNYYILDESTFKYALELIEKEKSAL